MNACSPVPAWAWVSGVCCGERLPPTVAPSHFLWRFVKRSVPPIAARRRDCGEGIEVEFDDRLQGFGGCAVVQAVRQGVHHAMYSACKAMSSPTASRQRCGECQASCRTACVMSFVYAAPPFRVFDWLWTKAAWTTASRSGLSVTAVIGVQFRV